MNKKHTYIGYLMKKLFITCLLVAIDLSVVVNIYADDDKIWGVWLIEKTGGTYQTLVRRHEYHLEKIKDVNDFINKFAMEQDFLDTYTVLGTMLYPVQGGFFIITNIEKITDDEYLLNMTTQVGSNGGIPIYLDGAVKMVFLDEDTAYFEFPFSVEQTIYSSIFRGSKEIKYRANVFGDYYPERAGITGYSEYMKQKLANYKSTHRTLENLRLRDSANTGSNIVTTLPKDAEVQVLETGSTATINGITATWVKVLSNSGYTGWCFSGYLEEIKGQSTAVSVNSNDGKNKATSLPLWAWFVFIGIAVAVSGGVAVFVVKLKK